MLSDEHIRLIVTYKLLCAELGLAYHAKARGETLAEETASFLEKEVRAIYDAAAALAEDNKLSSELVEILDKLCVEAMSIELFNTTKKLAELVRKVELYNPMYS